MAASGRRGTSFAKTKRMQGFIALLTSAACEWLLIFLLLVDSVLSYLLTKFASYCQLQLPCLLCSRLEKPEFYENLFCSNHKSEISSLILCHVHGKLADGHRMCDDCLLSVTANVKRNTKTHRLLVGKLGLGLGGSGSLSRDLFTGPKVSRPCTCCGRLWRSELNAPGSIQLKSPGRAVLKPYIPLPNVPRQSRLNHRGNLRRTRDKFSGSEGKSIFHPLSDAGYSVLRLTSDSESEFQFSDEDDVASVFHEDMEVSNGPRAQMTSVTPPTCVPSDMNPAKENGSSPKPMPLVNVSNHQDVNGNILVEINLQQENQKSMIYDLPELISLDEVSPSPIVVNVLNRESEAEESKNTSLSQNSFPALLSELMSLDGSITLVGSMPEKSVGLIQAPDKGIASEKHGQVSEEIVRSENSSNATDPLVCDSTPTSPRQENSLYMGEYPVMNKEREVTGLVIEQSTTEEIDKVKEDLELSPSHSSSLHGSNHVHSPEMHAETFSSNQTQELQKSPSVESGLESLDGSNVAEIEGEPLVDRLKRQVEYDKKCMDDLHKELEEERNAAAIAANEAMSMITRLQEEKAALQMEALQYLRMMEEQAEYDNDELDKVNDLLTDKEKEIQDLEAELEFYRLNFTEEPIDRSMHEESGDSKGENVTAQNIGVHNNTYSVNEFPHSQFLELSKVSHETAAGTTSFLEFEEEKQYISQCLKSVEKKLHQISCNEISSRMPIARPEKVEISELNQQGASNGEGPSLDGHKEIDSSIPKNIMSNGNHKEKDASAATDCDDCSISMENNHSVSVGPKTPTPRTEVELESLENEISDLNERLDALEFDHDLLEHIINSLQNGNGGKEFIQDIAHQLHELRKIGIRSR